MFLIFLCFTLVSAEFWADRRTILDQETTRLLGSGLRFNKREEMASEMLMKSKFKEYDYGFAHPETFPPARHFFDAKKDVENSEVFKFIQKMPKGAALHGHDTALTSFEVLHNLTFTDNLYACNISGRLNLKFMKKGQDDKTCNWTLINELREKNPDYDTWVQSQLTLVVPNPAEAYKDINMVWTALAKIFETVTPMLTYKPVLQEHFYQALKELYEDNVMYLEFRGTLPPVYDLDGKIYTPMETVGLYQETLDKFKKNHPDFFGARFIYAPMRDVDNSTVRSYIATMRELKKKYPDFMAGFDLVGQEDLGRPLSDFVLLLQDAAKDLDFIFHAAETNWYGTSTDNNIVDAVLLGTKRIGHGYAVVKHPIILEKMKQANIAVEICPISNQVLKLVEDLRNHPGAYLLAMGFPVVISYDDPTYWGAKGLSYDLYMAFMGLASRDADLKLLKQLARNSLEYSTLPKKEKKAALAHWEKQWDGYMEDLVPVTPTPGAACSIQNSVGMLTIGVLWCYLIAK